MRQKIRFVLNFEPNPLPEFTTYKVETVLHFSMAIVLSDNAWLSGVATKNFDLHHHYKQFANQAG
jgi:hypothetical protein